MSLQANAESPGLGRFQILSLEGGGIRGIFTASLLAGLEDDLGRPVVDHFDLVVGTSTGGIIALGLGAGLSPREILDFYVHEKQRVFPSMGWPGLRQLFRSKYSSAGLKSALQDVLGSRLLGDSKVPLVIPSYSLTANDVYLFKTRHHPRFNRDYRVPMWAVGMATAAAPTFFPVFKLPNDETRLIDGGIWANCPAMVGVTEAVSSFGRSLDEIRVLSVGTTASIRAARLDLDRGGIFGWGISRAIVDVLLDGQAAGAFAQVQHLIGKDHARRLNPIAPPELAGFDRCETNELIAQAAHHSRFFTPEFVQLFGDHVPATHVGSSNPSPQEINHAASGSH
jgi:patatin-like phospholipase/acyl hydrolase